MAGRKNHVSPTTLFFLLLIAAFTLLLLPQSWTDNLNMLYLSAFNPLLQIGRQTEHLRQSDGQYVARPEYDKLWKAYENLHTQLMKLHADYETLARVRQGLPMPGTGYLLGRVTNVNPGIRHEMVLDRGAASGVAVGQYVLSETGKGDLRSFSVLGTVSETAEQVCRIRLLTDPAQKLEVQIRRPGTDQMIAALMEGDGKTGGRICNLAWDYDVRQKDVVYAAPKPGLLEIPVVIGEISHVKRDDKSPVLWDIAVELVDNPLLQNQAVVLVPPKLESPERPL